MTTIASISFFTTAFLVSKGAVYNLNIENTVYGEVIDVESKSLFSTTKYEYKEINSDIWTKVKPTNAGTYQLKITTQKSFRRTKEKIVDFTIKPKETEVILVTENFDYGEQPEIEIELLSTDKVDFYSFSYTDLSSQRTEINLTNIKIVDSNNIDVTSNYKINYNQTIISFIQNEIVIKLNEYQNVYNGEIHQSDSFEIISGALIEGDEIVIETEGSLTNVGVLENKIISYKIYKDDIDVTNNYLVSTINSTIKVTPRNLSVKLVDKTKVYDGKELSSDIYEFLHQTSLLFGHTLNITSDGAITNAGSVVNNITSTTILEDGVDITNNYNINLIPGTLKVTKSPLTITSHSDTKEYDNTPLFNDGYSTIGNIAENESLDVLITNEIINTGLIKNDFTYIIKDKNGNDTTNNYDVTKIFGDLIIKRREIEVDVFNMDKIYDGNDMFTPEYLITSNSLIIDHNLEIILSVLNSSIGLKEVNEVTLIITNTNNNDVTHNYEVIYNLGSYNILKKEAEIISLSKTEQYNGTPLIENNYINSQLVINEFLTVKMINQITNVGKIDNDFTYIIKDINNVDVTHNYDVDKTIGELEVTPRILEVYINNMNKEYDGSNIFNPSYDITHNSLALFETLLFTLEVSNKHVGLKEVTDVSYIIYNKDEVDVTSNYELTYEYGTYNIYEKYLEITSLSKKEEYNGTPLKEYSYTNTSLVIGDYLIVDMLNDITTVGKVSNDFTYLIKDSDDFDVTHNYNVNKILGELEVTLRIIHIDINDTDKTYDGTNIFNPEYIMTLNELVIDHTLSIEVIVNNSDEGIKGVIRINYTLTDEFNNDVKSNYLIIENIGIFNILKKEIEIRSYSKTKEYDGTPLKEEGFFNDELVSKEELTVDMLYEIIDVDIIDNDFTYIIKDENKRDVTHNYEVTKNLGKLEVTPRILEVNISSVDKEYDGNSIFNPEYNVTSNSLVGNHILYFNLIANNSDYGLKEIIEVTYIIFDEFDEPQTHNYTINYEYGVYNISKKDLFIDISDYEKVFDGTNIFTPGYINEEGLVNYQTISITIYTNFEVGVNEVIDLLIVVTDIYDEDVSHNYNIDYKLGVYTILLRDITIELVDKEKEYDRTPLTSTEYNIFDGSLVIGHTVELSADGSRTEIGVSDNHIIDIDIYDEANESFIRFYNITYLKGILEVVRRNIYVQVIDQEKEYDGTPLTSDEAFIFSGSLLSGHELLFKGSGSQTNIGSSINDALILNIVDENNITVDEYYFVSLTLGELKVVRRTISIKPMDKEKLYDGTPLISNDPIDMNGKLLEGHHIYIETDGSQIDPGESFNNIVYYTILNDLLENVEEFYEVTLSNGLLTVTIEEQDKIEFDGDMSVDGPFDDETPLLEVLTDVDGTIYLRHKSYGDYDGKHTWLEANQYTNSYINPLSIPGIVLDDLYGNKSLVLVKQLEDLGIYLMPYYSIGGFYDSLDDREIKSLYYREYALYYSNRNVESLNFEMPPEYQSILADYNTFVYQNYLSLPGSTSARLFSYLDANNIDLSSGTLIKDVQELVLNAGVYNLNHPTFDAEGDYIIDFLMDVKEGVCIHFAASAVAIYRTLGIPARYTTGFIAHVKNGETVTVPAKNAHAWVEVYIKDFGWVPIEVTPGDPYGGDGYFDDEPRVEEDGDQGLINLDVISRNSVKKFDGTPLIRNSYYYNGDLLDGHNIDIEFLESVTDVGKKLNKFNIRIINEDGNDVSHLYNIRKVYGDLVVVENDDRELLGIELFSKEVVYDSFSKRLDDYYISTGELLGNHRIEFDILGSIKEVGFLISTIDETTIVIYDEYNNNVTHLYNVVPFFGILEIVKKTITITSLSSEKYYDGKKLIYQEYSRKGNVVSGHELIVRMPSEITEVGSIINKIEDVIILDLFGDDVTRNYEIIIREFGILTVFDTDE